MKPKYVLDIGGSKTECLYVGTGEIEQTFVATPDTGTFDSDFEIWKNSLQSFLSRPASAVNVSFSGLMIDGIVVKWPNRPSWEGTPLLPLLQELFENESVHIDEDANMGALTNLYLFPDAKHTLYVNVGTGIGLGMVHNGEIYTGVNGYAGELGHTVIEPESERICTCGKNGCLQLFASGRGMLRILQDTNCHFKKAKSLEQLALFKGDREQAEILEVLTQGAMKLGIALANLINLLDITSIHLGGSVMKDDRFTKSVLTTVEEQEQTFLKRKIDWSIHPFENASLIGTFLKSTNYFSLEEKEMKRMDNFLKERRS